MKVLLIEFVWQVEKIINDKIAKSYDLIISLDPECSYILKSNAISFKESDEILDDELIIKDYEKLSLNSLKICSLIDQELFKIDKNFNQLNWKIFNDFHYCMPPSPAFYFLYKKSLT